MFTDMVGFTSISQRSEGLAIRMLEKQREIVRKCISDHRGKEVKTMGDAFLVIFDSATDSLECAISIQKSIIVFNKKKEFPEFSLRIGIHMGEVVEENRDIYGDSVNIASRIEPLAEKGGICITQAVWEQVRNKVEVEYVRMKETRLKNVSDRFQIYRVILNDQSSNHGIIEDETKSRREYVRIAVLPLRDLSERNGFFADGLTDELIFALSRVKALRVIARTSVMKYKSENKSAREIGRELDVDYIVEGSIRKSQARILCQVQLVDTGTEESIWAQSYMREMKDIFETQAEIAGKVCSSLRSRIQAPSRVVITNLFKKTDNINAFTLYLKGRHYWNKRDERSIKKAMKFFEMSIMEDKNYAKAYSGLADCYAFIGNYMIADSKEAFMNAVKYARKAIELDPMLAEAHSSLGAVLGSYYMDFDEAEKEMKKAINLNPSYATAHHWYSTILLSLGRINEAMKELEVAYMLDPFSDIILTALALGHLYSGDVQNGIKYCQTVIRRNPKFLIAYNALGECYLQTGNIDKAMSQYSKALALNKNDSLTLAYLAHAHALRGNKEEAMRIVKELKDKVKEPELSSLLAVAYSGFSDVERVFDYIRNAHIGRTLIVEDLRYSPIYSSVRNDPRFSQLLQEILSARVVNY
jgi:adenylate cyclase